MCSHGAGSGPSENLEPHPTPFLVLATNPRYGASKPASGATCSPRLLDSRASCGSGAGEQSTRAGRLPGPACAHRSSSSITSWRPPTARFGAARVERPCSSGYPTSDACASTASLVSASLRGLLAWQRQIVYRVSMRVSIEGILCISFFFCTI